MKKLNLPAILLALAAIFCLQAQAQEGTPHSTLSNEEIKQANNPLAPKKTFNVHNYLMSSLYGAPDLAMNNLMFRYAQPVGNILLRATMPMMTESAPGVSPVSGFGDFSLFAIYKFKGTPEGISVGVGPMIIVPTGSHGFSQDKWQAGISALAFFSKSHIVQMGTLLQWQTSFADEGNKDAEDVSILTPQVFFMWQIGGGTYLRNTGIWSFNLKNGDYNIPIGLGIGKVIKSGGVIFNIFAEPQLSVLAQGAGQPRFQTFIGFNTQF